VTSIRRSLQYNTGSDSMTRRIGTDEVPTESSSTNDLFGPNVPSPNRPLPLGTSTYGSEAVGLKLEESVRYQAEWDTNSRESGQTDRASESPTHERVEAEATSGARTSSFIVEEE
jgi:hypothetical protein